VKAVSQLSYTSKLTRGIYKSPMVACKCGYLKGSLASARLLKKKTINHVWLLV